jgi:putative membrane protein
VGDRGAANRNMAHALHYSGRMDTDAPVAGPNPLGSRRNGQRCGGRDRRFPPSDEDDAAMAEEEESPRLGYERTKIASERTLMAWVRTAVSLIGFGFSIPKFFSYLAEAESLKGVPGVSPKLLGALLIALGTGGLLGGIVEHVQLVKRVAPPGRGRDRISAAMLTSLFVGLIGLLTLFSVLLT